VGGAGVGGAGGSVSTNRLGAGGSGGRTGAGGRTSTAGFGITGVGAGRFSTTFGVGAGAGGGATGSIRGSAVGQAWAAPPRPVGRRADIEHRRAPHALLEHLVADPGVAVIAQPLPTS